MSSAADISCSVAFRASVSRDGGGEVALAAAVGEHVGDRCVDRMQIEPGLAQPLLQRANRRVIVIIEVASRREHLDRFESVRRDLEQVGLLQPLFVIEVSRNAKSSS